MYNMNMWENVQLLTDPKMVIHKTYIEQLRTIVKYQVSGTKYHSEVSPRPCTRTWPKLSLNPAPPLSSWSSGSPPRRLLASGSTKLSTSCTNCRLSAMTLASLSAAVVEEEVMHVPAVLTSPRHELVAAHPLRHRAVVQDPPLGLRRSERKCEANFANAVNLCPHLIHV